MDKSNGTLKLNTRIATLQMIDRICDVAFNFFDEEMKAMSWTTFDHLAAMAETW